MKQYLMKLTPLEAYFFGNEKSFKYPKQENSGQMSNQYYIKSESVPAQTTLLGMLRYLLLPVKKSNFADYTDADKKINAEVVGNSSFDFEQKDRRFGIIKAISPVFLTKNDEIFMKTPFDHKTGKKTYTPFSKYGNVQTPQGEKLFCKEYNPKDGISDSYMNISTGEIVESKDVFSAEVRVGINRENKEKGFFKKEYKCLFDGFSFGAYVTLDTDLPPDDTTVFLGQGKSAFKVSFKEDADKIEEMIRKHIREDVIYVASDSFVEEKPYNDALFAITDTKNYRAYTTNYGSITKGSRLYKLIVAGSVFIPKDKKSLIEKFKAENAENIGFNKIISGGLYI